MWLAVSWADDWAQEAGWPRNNPQDWLVFVLQLDWQLCSKTPWCSGGYAYVFIKPDRGGLKGEFVLQNT
jgi:hypothetical protein